MILPERQPAGSTQPFLDARKYFYCHLVEKSFELHMGHMGHGQSWATLYDAFVVSTCDFSGLVLFFQLQDIQ